MKSTSFQCKSEEHFAPTFQANGLIGADLPIEKIGGGDPERPWLDYRKTFFRYRAANVRAPLRDPGPLAELLVFDGVHALDAACVVKHGSDVFRQARSCRCRAQRAGRCADAFLL